MSDHEDELVLTNSDGEDNLNQDISEDEEDEVNSFEETLQRKLHDENIDMKPFVDVIFDFFMNNDIGQISKFHLLYYVIPVDAYANW